LSVRRRTSKRLQDRLKQHVLWIKILQLAFRNLENYNHDPFIIPPLANTH